jgi:hypothetical protein
MLARAHPPDWSYKAVHKMQKWPHVRPLHHLAETPVLLPDGSLVATEGYDAPTGILYRPRLTVPTVPELPTEEEVRAAAEALLDIVCDFPFEMPAHRSAWLAALLTPLARWAFADQTPFFMFDANQSGSGKGMLLKVIGWIVLGREMDFVVQTADEEEERKRITSKIRSREPMVLIDDIDKPFGSSALDAALTSGVWGDRLLGSNEAPRLDAWLTWYGSGNNVVFKRDDTRRRTCVVRISTNEVRPEERTGFKYPALPAHVLECRGALIAAALTMLRGWIRLGKRASDMAGWGGAWGSFDAWDQVVRGALLYAGLPDLLEAKATAAATAASTNALVQFVEGIDEAARSLGGEPSVAEVLEALKDNDDWRRSDKSTPVRFKRLRGALADLLPRLRAGELPNSYQLGQLFARYRDKPVDTAAGRKRLVVREIHGTNRWRVEPVPGPPDADIERAAIVEEGVPARSVVGPDGCCERCRAPRHRACGLCSQCPPSIGGCPCRSCVRGTVGAFGQTAECNLCGKRACRCRRCGECTQTNTARGGCCC